MKYKTEINEAYQRIGYTPRDNQIEYVNEIVTSAIDEGISDIIVNAPTGTGKSIIAAAAADTIGVLKGNPSLCSLILMHNNALVKQYASTFSKNRNFMMLKGANQYPCDALNSQLKPGDERKTAEDCIQFILKKHSQTRDLAGYCDGCEYAQVKALKNEMRHVITNYSYFFVSTMFAHNLDPRLVNIFDEAHTLNDVFTEHNAIYVSDKRLSKIADEIVEHLNLGNTDVFKKIKKMRDDLLKGKMNENTYMDYMAPLLECYKYISDTAGDLADKNEKNLPKYQKYSRLHKKFFNLGCKIGDLISFGYEHVPQFNEHPEKELTVKPVFIGDMFNKVLRTAEFNIFMSATITDAYMIKTMNLDPSKVKLVQFAPSFDPSNKKIVFYNPVALNYNSMKEEKVMKSLDRNVLDIALHHSKKKESGIILTPSFVVTERIANLLRSKVEGFFIFEHERGQKLESILLEFKDWETPGVLISPSMFEGIDLPDDASRFQIFVKCPFASLGDKRIAYILRHHPDLYELITLKRVIQGAGRSVRNKEDFAITYMLDTNIQRLWKSKQNIWKNEFRVSQKSSFMED